MQTILQNKSGTTGASTNYVLSNDLGTDSTYYGEFGMNSSVFSSGTPSDFFSINNGVYFSGHDGDLTYGSGNGYKSYFAWGSTGASAHVINTSGAIGLSTNLGTTPALSGTTGFGTAGQVMISNGSGAANTWSSTPTLVGTNFTGIPNGALTNSSIIFGATAAALGSTVSALNAVSIGATTASTGAFTTLSASSTVSGVGFSNYLAAPPAIGGTTPAAITGTTITANTGFSGNGSSLTSLNASNLASGTVPTVRLGSGTANSTTFLRGDNTWAIPVASAGGSNTQIQYNSSGALAGSSNLTFDGSNMYLSGNLGLGITPTVKLHVYNINATAAATFKTVNGTYLATDVYINNASDDQMLISARSNGDVWFRNDYTGGSLYFGTNGSLNFNINSAGVMFSGNGDRVMGLARGTLVNSTSGTSIDFTGIPAGAKRITIMFNQVSTSGTGLVQVQLGSGSIQTTGYTGAASYIGAATVLSSGSITNGIAISNNNAASDVRTGVLTLVNESGNIWIGTSVVALTSSATTGLGGGNVTLSGTLDRVRITTSNGTDTFDNGSVNVIWE